MSWREGLGVPPLDGTRQVTFFPSASNAFSSTSDEKVTCHGLGKLLWHGKLLPGARRTIRQQQTTSTSERCKAPSAMSDCLVTLFGIRLVELAVEPGFGVGPVAVGGGPRDAQRLGGFLVRKPGEATQLHQLG